MCGQDTTWFLFHWRQNWGSENLLGGNACERELREGRGIGRGSLRLRCSSDLCENEGGSIWEKETQEYYSEMVSAGPAGTLVQWCLFRSLLGKMPRPSDQFMAYLAIVLDWKTGGSWSHCSWVCQQAALLWHDLSRREIGVKYHLGGYSGPLLFKISGWATRVKRELHYLFRSCGPQVPYYAFLLIS